MMIRQACKHQSVKSAAVNQAEMQKNSKHLLKSVE